MNWIDKVLDYRWIYIMKLKRKGQYKIGIASDPKWRNRNIDEAVEGRVYILMKRRTFFAEWKEKKMHKIFDKKRFTKWGAGSGKTEWFKFNPIEAACAMIWLWWYSNRLSYFIASLFAFIVIFFLRKQII